MKNTPNEERKHELARGFDLRAAAYHRAPWISDPRLLEYPISLLAMTGTECVIELGVGSGAFAKAIAPRAAHFVGVDISRQMLFRAAQALPEVSLLQHDCETLDSLFISGAFDIAVTRNLLHHVEIPKILGSAHRILKSKGRLLIVEASVVSPEHSSFFLGFSELLHPGHVDYPSHAELEEMVRLNGFELDHTEILSKPISLNGYLESIARSVDEKMEILDYFLSAPPDVRDTYQIHANEQEVYFLGHWSILVAHRG